MTYQEAKEMADEAWKVYERNPTRENMAYYSTLADRADNLKETQGRK